MVFFTFVFFRLHQSHHCLWCCGTAAIHIIFKKSIIKIFSLYILSYFEHVIMINFHKIESLGLGQMSSKIYTQNVFEKWQKLIICIEKASKTVTL